MTSDYCILVDEIVHGWFECEDDGMMWNTVCAYADRFREELLIDGIDTHLVKHRTELKIDFVEVLPIYYGLSTMHRVKHTLSVQPLFPITLKFKSN